MRARVRWHRAAVVARWLVLAVALGVGVAAAAAPSPPLVTVRLFLDLQDPLCREAWQVYRRVLTPLGADAALRVHHLPLVRHPHARAAAQAAAHAASKGLELGFIDALQSHPVPDAPALAGAAAIAGLSPADVARAAASASGSDLAQRVERDRQAAVAFGVRAAPSALINGRGVAGVPPAGALGRAVEGARQACAALRAGGDPIADCEVAGVRASAPASEGAFEILRKGAAPIRPAAPSVPTGHLGERFRVELAGDELSTGGPAQPVTAVFFADLLDPTQRADLQTLLSMAAKGGVRVVVIALPRLDPGSRGPAREGSLRMALALLALQARLPPAARAAVIAGLGERQAAGMTAVERLASRHGVSATMLREAAASPVAAVRLDAALRLASLVDARPGALYLNGRRWHGRLDASLAPALAEVRKEADALVARGVQVGRIYPALVSQGRVIVQAERDLQAPETLGDTEAMPLLCGISAPDGRPALPVHLFVDFQSLASRAAFHGLRHLCRHDRHPIALRMVSITSAAKPGVSPSGATFVVAASRGSGLEIAQKLFSMRDPNAWGGLKRLAKRMGISLKQLQSQVDGPAATAAAATAMRLKAELEMDDDPVLYIDGRRYLGPIDEQRIIAAVAFAWAHRQAAAGGRP